MPCGSLGGICLPGKSAGHLKQGTALAFPSGRIGIDRGGDLLQCGDRKTLFMAADRDVGPVVQWKNFSAAGGMNFIPL